MTHQAIAAARQAQALDWRLNSAAGEKPQLSLHPARATHAKTAAV